MDGNQEGKAARGYLRASCGITASWQHQHMERQCKVIIINDGSD